MSTAEWLLVLVFAPLACFVAGWLGRRWQRMHWRYDLPYEERVKLLRG